MRWLVTRLIRMLPPPTDARRPTVVDYLEYAVFRVALAFFSFLPRGVAMTLGVWLGEIFYVFDRRDRRIALLNLRLALPDWSERERRAMLRRSCRNFGRMGAECSHFGELTAASVGDYVTIEDPERWQATLDRAAGPGVVILTAHFGNFELLAYVRGLLGHPSSVVYKPMRNPLVDRFVIEMRARAGTRSIPKKAAAKAALRALREGRVVAILSDQNQMRRYGVFVDFFGVPCSTTPGPARLGMLTGAPVVPIFIVRDGESDRHRIIVLPEVEMVRTDDRDADIVTNTQRCTAVIEDVIRRYPDQWIWFHRRWKTRPLGEPRIY